MNAAPQTVINQDAPEEKRRLTADEVLAQWQQNAGGGIGVGIVAGLIALAAAWGMGASWQGMAKAVAVAMLGSGLLAFGLLMAVRSVIDEVMDGQAWRNMVADLEMYEVDLSAAEETIKVRNARIKELERELAGAREAARGKNFTPAEPPADSPVAEDVREMIRIRYAIDAHPSRRYMKDTYQWSQPRHERAMAELRRAGIVTDGGNGPEWPGTMLEAIDLLTAAAP